jgi:hypothetical protein
MILDGFADQIDLLIEDVRDGAVLRANGKRVPLKRAIHRIARKNDAPLYSVAFSTPFGLLETPPQHYTTRAAAESAPAPRDALYLARGMLFTPRSLATSLAALSAVTAPGVDSAAQLQTTLKSLVLSTNMLLGDDQGNIIFQ